MIWLFYTMVVIPTLVLVFFTGADMSENDDYRTSDSDLT